MRILTNQHPGRELGPLIAVTTSALMFAALLAAVRLRWVPLEAADRGVAVYLNSAISAHPLMISIVKVVTSLGSDAVLAVVLAAAIVFLTIRRRWHLAGYLLATAAGAFVLDPVLKSLVGRLRPVAAHPVAHGIGPSFPSGHAFDSMVCYGALMLIFLPAARGRWRAVLIAAAATLVVLIGISRIVLDVHFVSDVAGGWAIGVAWLGVTVTAFEVTRQRQGLPVTNPVTEGLEPQDRSELRPAEPQAPQIQAPGGTDRSPRRTAAMLLVAWVLILGAVTGLGELVTRFPGGNLLGDRTIPGWLAAHRTPALDRVSLIFTDIGSTGGIVVATALACMVLLAVTRRWRPVRFVAIVMAGEISIFLIASLVIQRPRPHVPHLDQHAPPTSSYPSGHSAATTCLYLALAIVAIGLARGWWRCLALIPAVALPILVAASRMYRGEHHPTDVLGSLVLAGLWLTTTTIMLRPNAAQASRTRSPVHARRERVRTTSTRPLRQSAR